MYAGDDGGVRFTFLRKLHVGEILIDEVLNKCLVWRWTVPNDFDRLISEIFLQEQKSLSTPVGLLVEDGVESYETSTPCSVRDEV